MSFCLCGSVSFLFIHRKLIIHQRIHIYRIIFIDNLHIILFAIHGQGRCCFFRGQISGKFLINLCHRQPLFCGFVFVNGQLNGLISALLSIGHFCKSFYVRYNIHHVIADFKQLIGITSVNIHSKSAGHIRGHIHIRCRYTVIFKFQIFADFFQLFCHRTVVPGSFFIQ